MRYLGPVIAIFVAASVHSARSSVGAAEPIVPFIELQSDPLTPALTLDGFARPIYQIRILVDAKMAKADLILDGNLPQFDEFGNLTGGLQTPHVRANGDPERMTQIACTIALEKSGTSKWRRYRIDCPKLNTSLRIATRGPIGDGGPSRILILQSDNKPSAVIQCTTYGLVVP